MTSATNVCNRVPGCEPIVWEGLRCQRRVNPEMEAEADARAGAMATKPYFLAGPTLDAY